MLPWIMASAKAPATPERQAVRIPTETGIPASNLKVA